VAPSWFGIQSRNRILRVSVKWDLINTCDTWDMSQETRTWRCKRWCALRKCDAPVIARSPSGKMRDQQKNKHAGGKELVTGAINYRDSSTTWSWERSWAADRPAKPTLYTTYRPLIHVKVVATGVTGVICNPCILCHSDTYYRSSRKNNFQIVFFVQMWAPHNGIIFALYVCNTFASIPETAQPRATWLSDYSDTE